MKAVWNKRVLAESDDVIEVEGNFYFPKESIEERYFDRSPNRSECPWKGTAFYYHLDVDGSINENAAWYYPEPKEEASHIKDRIAFWKGVVIED